MVFKPIVVLCCLLVAAFADEKYTDKYDHINIQEVIENNKLLTAYNNCILDKGKCTPEGKELREHIQDALETGCKKCTDVQQDGVKTVLNHLISKKPDVWKELCAKYDPQGIWRKKYEDQAKENGIVIPQE